MWIEPASNNDVIMYQPSYQPPIGVSVNFLSTARKWVISGTASTEIYSSILQVGSGGHLYEKDDTQTFDHAALATTNRASAVCFSSMKDMYFRNNGPVVEVNGSPNRTVWFRVEDINGRTVRVAPDSAIESQCHQFGLKGRIIVSSNRNSFLEGFFSRNLNCPL